MNHVTLDTITTADDLIRLGITPRTLAEQFAASYKEIGTLFVPDRAPANRHEAGRKVARAEWESRNGGLPESLTLGELYALWVSTKIDTLDDAYYEFLGVWLAKLEADEVTVDEFRDATDRAERSYKRGRNAATKKAYGITYTEYSTLV